MTTKEILIELEYALLYNDIRNQEELYKLLEEKGMSRDEASIRAFSVYLRGE